MKTWREIRKNLLTASGTLTAILQGRSVPTHFYTPLESPFNAFEDVTPEELEIICDEEMRLLLCGFQSDNIRIQFDAETKRPISLIPNPSFDPYMRSAIDRFSDVIHDLYVIRVYGHEIRADLLRSRIARVVVYKITQKVELLLEPILVQSSRRQTDEGFHDSDYGLNGITRNIAVIKSTIRCFSKIVLYIYMRNLSGGEIIDLIEEKLQQAVKDRQELQLLSKEAWKIFFEQTGTWISFGRIEDINREFFIWSVKGIPTVDVEQLEKDQLDTGIVSDGRYVIIQDLCPNQIRPYMKAIYQCGHNCRPDIENNHFNWSAIENPARFIQKVNILSKEMSSSALKQIRTESKLDEFLYCYFTTMLNSPWLTQIAATLKKKGLPERVHNEVAEGVLKSLTHQTLYQNIGHFPLLEQFVFAKDTANLFDALSSSSYVTGTHLSTLKNNSDTIEPILADRITIKLTLLPGLERVISTDVIHTISLIFRLQLRLMLAVIILDSKKADVCRNMSDVRDRNQLKEYRRPLYLLHQLSQYLLRFRLKLMSAVREAQSTFYERLTKANQVEDVSRLLMDFVAQIFKEGQLTQEHLNCIEDLIEIVVSFSFDYTFDNLWESYNEWLGTVESARFLNTDVAGYL